MSVKGISWRKSNQCKGFRGERISDGKLSGVAERE